MGFEQRGNSVHNHIKRQHYYLKLEEYDIIIMVFIIAENMEWEGGIPMKAFPNVGYENILPAMALSP